MMYDIVIPFRNTCGTEELKMCVKLIKKNLKLPYKNIVIVGDSCDFKDENVINEIVQEQKYNKWLDSSFLVQYYIHKLDGHPFILFNDDFFLTKEVDKIPNYYFDTLSNRILTTYIIDEKNNKLKLSAYGLNIQKFINEFGDFRNYEVHIPMIVEDPLKMSFAIDLTKTSDCPALKRTMYMKLLDKKEKDYSLKNDIKFGEPLKIIQYPFFSLTDREFNVFKKDFEEILKK